MNEESDGEIEVTAALSRAEFVARVLAEEFGRSGTGAKDLSDAGDLTEFIVYGPFDLRAVAAAVDRALVGNSLPWRGTASE